jgi:hypothetical protein
LYAKAVIVIANIPIATHCILSLLIAPPSSYFELGAGAVSVAGVGVGGAAAGAVGAADAGALVAAASIALFSIICF